MNFPDWLEKVNAYLWLCAVAILLIVVSLIYNEKYLLLWMLTYLYGLIGFANDVGLKKHEKTRWIFSLLLLIGYVALFVFSTVHCGIIARCS